MKRRELFMSGLLGLAAFLTACDKESTSSTPATTPSTQASTGAGGGGVSTDKELNLYAWSEYVPQTVIDGFSKETGIKVNYETYASNEEMLSKLLAGATKYDLIQPSEYTIEALIKQKK